MTESTFGPLRVQPRILFWDATAAHRHAVPAADEVFDDPLAYADEPHLPGEER